VDVRPEKPLTLAAFRKQLLVKSLLDTSVT
jgi:hypothetical protein